MVIFFFQETNSSPFELLQLLNCIRAPIRLHSFTCSKPHIRDFPHLKISQQLLSMSKKLERTSFTCDEYVLDSRYPHSSVSAFSPPAILASSETRTSIPSACIKPRISLWKEFRMNPLHKFVNSYTSQRHIY